MKELSVEEKAKRYDEAIERAKEKYAMFEGMKQGDVLEDVFPELKESGYLKGKDLELTWKDIKKIYHLVNEVSDDLGIKAMYVNIYQETLKRFKAQKGE